MATTTGNEHPYHHNWHHVYPMRLWVLLFTIVAATLACVGFIPGVDIFLAPYLRDARNVTTLSLASLFLAVYALIAFFLGMNNYHQASVLPEYALEQRDGYGAEQASAAKRIDWQASFTSRAGGLSVGKIFEEELEYAGRTADQAMEQRMTLVNFYLLISGGVGTGVVSLVSANSSGGNRDFIIAGVPLLWLLAMIGGVVLLQLIALRRAYYDSLLAMNYIKYFFANNAQHLARADVEKAFLWKPSTIPPPHKSGNVYYYAAVLIALLNSSAFFSGIYLLGWTRGAELVNFPSAVIAFLLTGMFYAVHLLTFRMMLIPLPKKNDPVPYPALTAPPEPDYAYSAIGSANVPTRIRQTSHPADARGGFVVTGTHEVFRGRVVTLRVDDLNQPDGSPTKREVVEHVPAVVIVAYRSDTAEVALVQQYRHPIGKMLWEVPAGLVDAGESPETAARRELREETGFDAQTLISLGHYYTSPGFTDEEHLLFLATNLVATNAPIDPNEIAHLQWIKLADALAQIDSGAIEDSKTIIGLLRLASRLPGRV